MLESSHYPQHCSQLETKIPMRKMIRGWQDGSVSEGTNHQTRWPEFDIQFDMVEGEN